MAEKHVDKVRINYECPTCGETTTAVITESDLRQVSGKADSTEDAFAMLCSSGGQLLSNPQLLLFIAGALGVGASAFAKGVVQEAGSHSFRELMQKLNGSSDEAECGKCESLLNIDIDIEIGSLITINIGNPDDD